MIIIEKIKEIEWEFNNFLNLNLTLIGQGLRKLQIRQKLNYWLRKECYDR